MTWTYSQDPLSSTTDEVRFLVGDTDETDPIVQDEEIDYYLSIFPKPTGMPAWMAAAQTCDAIAAKFARRMDSSVGALQQSAEQQYLHYVQLATYYRTMFATNGLGPSAADDGSSGFGRVPAAAPVLSGGGQTYLGGLVNLTGGPVTD